MADDDLVNPTYDDDGNAEWDVAGYTDWEGEYHQAPEGGFTELDFDEIDMVTIGWTDADNGEMQYANLVGPFEDWDDLDDNVDTYFEEGS